MAQGDGELLSGLGNLIGAVTNTIQRKNDQDFSLRREDTMARLQAERDALLMQTQAAIQSSQQLRNQQIMLQGQAAEMGMSVKKGSLADTGGIGAIVSMANTTLEERINNLSNQETQFLGNIEGLNDAMGMYREGAKNYAASLDQMNDIWKDGATPAELTEHFDLMYGEGASQLEENYYKLQGHIAAGTDREMYEKIKQADLQNRLGESQILTEEQKRKESEATLRKIEAELTLLPFQQKQMQMAIMNANLVGFNQATELSAKLQAEADTAAATLIDRIMPGDFFNRAQSIYQQQGVTPEMADQSVNRLITNEFFTKSGNYYDGTQVAIQMTADQRLISEMLNSGDLEKFLQFAESRQNMSVSEKALIEAAFARGQSQGFNMNNPVDFISDMFNPNNRDGLQEDGGAAMKKIAISYLHWKQTGKFSTDTNITTKTYSNYVSSITGEIENQMSEGLRKITKTPTSLVAMTESFTSVMHDSKTGANSMGALTKYFYVQYSRKIAESNMRFGTQIPILTESQFADKFAAHNAFGNLPANKQTINPTTMPLMNLAATAGLFGSVDMSNPGYSEAAQNLYAALSAGANIEYASMSPAELMEISKYGNEALSQQKIREATFIGEGASAIPRNSFFSAFQNLVRATSSLNEYNMRSTGADRSYILAPVRNRQDAANRDLNEAWKAFGNIK